MRCFLRVGFSAAVWFAAAASALGDCGPSQLERGTVSTITHGGDIVLTDARRLRLAGLHYQTGLDHQSYLSPSTLKSGDQLAFGVLGENKDRWLRYAAMVFKLDGDRPPDWLQRRLLSEGRALIRPELDLGACWALLKQTEAEFSRNLPKSVPEGGRFTRVEGRVLRVGEGRSAHFINLVDPLGERITGLVQKRYLRRFKEAGVDVSQLRGQSIRLRGVRNVRNISVIPLTMVEQIEMIR